MIAPSYKGHTKIRGGSAKATKIVSLRNKSYEERLASLNLLSLKQRQLLGKLNECFKILKGFTSVDTCKVFSVDDTSRTRSNGVKLKCKQVQLDSTKFFFTWLGMK